MKYDNNHEYQYDSEIEDIAFEYEDEHQYDDDMNIVGDFCREDLTKSY